MTTTLGQWRTITTDSESQTGIAPVCKHQRDYMKHSTGEGYMQPPADEYGVYDCCPEPQIEMWNETVAGRLVSVLNAMTDPTREAVRKAVTHAWSRGGGEIPAETGAQVELYQWMNDVAEAVSDAHRAEDRPLPDGAAPAFSEWCLVELLGHRRVAAHVQEMTLAGAGMLRLDEPATAGHPARTQLVNPASVYAIHPTIEAVVVAMAARWRQDPVSRWELPQQLRAAADGLDEDEADGAYASEF
jgi:hypothetical protein